LVKIKFATLLGCKNPNSPFCIFPYILKNQFATLLESKNNKIHHSVFRLFVTESLFCYADAELLLLLAGEGK
jgi:hypothetical protein